MVGIVSTNNFIWGKTEENLLSSLKVLSSLGANDKVRVMDETGFLIAKDDRWRTMRWFTSDNWDTSIKIVHEIIGKCFLTSKKSTQDETTNQKKSELNSHYITALQGLDTLRITYLSLDKMQAAEKLLFNITAFYLDAVSRINNISLNTIEDLYPLVPSPDAPAAPPIADIVQIFPLVRSPAMNIFPRPIQYGEPVSSSPIEIPLGTKTIMRTGEPGALQFQPALSTITGIQLKPTPKQLKSSLPDRSPIAVIFHLAKSKHDRVEKSVTTVIHTRNASFSKSMAARREIVEDSSDSEEAPSIYDWDENDL